MKISNFPVFPHFQTIPFSSVHSGQAMWDERNGYDFHDIFYLFKIKMQYK